MTKENAEAKSTKKEREQRQKEEDVDLEQNQLRVVSAVSYLGILFFVPMLVYPKNDFALFHANQGLLLLITAIILNILMSGIFMFPLGYGYLLYRVIWLIPVILFVIGLVNALNGRKDRLPIIGNFDLINSPKEK